MTIMEESAEFVWNQWLACLEPWEIHWLTSRELELHDRFINQKVSLVDIEAMIEADHAPRTA